jgi:hypothetical protein
MQNSKLNRRSLIALFGATGTAVAAPAAAAVTKTAATSPADRMAYHLGEFQKAAEEADPRICRWSVERGEDHDNDDLRSISIVATRRQEVRFAGEGTYLMRYSRDSDPFRATVVFDNQGGDLRFRVDTLEKGMPERWWTTERKLNEMILAKVRAGRI